MDFLEALKKGPLFFDGAMGTMLQKAGLRAGMPGEVLNLKDPETVLNVQRAYAAAGCDIIQMNTFGANRIKVAKSGLVPASQAADEAAAYIRAAAKIAGQALAQGRPEQLKETRGPGFLALDIGPVGEFLEPFGDLGYDEAYDAFYQMTEACGSLADLVLVETMYDLNEARAAVTAARDCSSLPVVLSATLSAEGRTLMGGSIEDIVSAAYETGCCAVGLNCGYGPEDMLGHLPELIAQTEKMAAEGEDAMPVLIMPNAGLPKNIGGVNVYGLSPEDFAVSMKKAADGGAALLGGCCGTTPEHMRRMIEMLRG